MRHASAKSLLRGARESSFLRSFSEARLNEFFEKVRRFVSRKFPSLLKAKLHVDCRKIYAFRKQNPGYLGERALMHVGCNAVTVCSIRWAAGLSDGNLAALFLHEFGHLGGGFDEPAANAWIKKHFGITIEYRGPLDLEWVPPLVARRILARHSSSPSP